MCADPLGLALHPPTTGTPAGLGLRGWGLSSGVRGKLQIHFPARVITLEGRAPQLGAGADEPCPESTYWFGGHTSDSPVSFVTEHNRSDHNQPPFSMFAQILFSCFLDLLK